MSGSVAAQPSDASAVEGQRMIARALAIFVVGYNVTHHSGLFYGSRPALDGTRLADWLDMLTPVAVLGPLLLCLVQVRPAAKWWAVFAGGVLLYVQGHGIHLAANSVSNVIDSGNAAADVVHLWDEVVGHYVWYAGAYLAMLAVVGALHDSELLVNRWALIGGGAVSGLTWATNGLEGGTAVFSLVLALGGVAYGTVHRRDAAVAVGVAGVVAALTLSAYGIWHAGFPQPSAL